MIKSFSEQIAICWHTLPYEFMLLYNILSYTVAQYVFVLLTFILPHFLRWVHKLPYPTKLFERGLYLLALNCHTLSDGFMHDCSHALSRYFRLLYVWLLPAMCLISFQAAAPPPVPAGPVMNPVSDTNFFFFLFYTRVQITYTASVLEFSLIG